MKTELFKTRKNLSSDFWTFVAQNYFDNDKKAAKRNLRDKTNFTALELSDIEKLKKAGLSADIEVLKEKNPKYFNELLKAKK